MLHTLAKDSIPSAIYLSFHDLFLKESILNFAVSSVIAWKLTVYTQNHKTFCPSIRIGAQIDCGTTCFEDFQNWDRPLATWCDFGFDQGNEVEDLQRFLLSCIILLFWTYFLCAGKPLTILAGWHEAGELVCHKLIWGAGFLTEGLKTSLHWAKARQNSVLKLSDLWLLIG